MNLIDEAEKVAEELRDVVFVGAVAIFAHIGYRSRGTEDIDLAMSTILSEEELEKRGYRKYYENNKWVTRTPRGIKVDIYTEDVGRIPISTIYETATEITGKNRKIKVACIEVLLITKHRAGRAQDIEDLQNLCRIRGKKLNWSLLQQIANDTEIAEIRNVVNAFK